MASKAKKPRATAQEKAMNQRQSRELDREIGKNEKRFKALARNKLGAKSLLGGTMKGKSGPSSAPKSVYGNVSPTAPSQARINASQGFTN